MGKVGLYFGEAGEVGLYCGEAGLYYKEVLASISRDEGWQLD